MKIFSSVFSAQRSHSQTGQVRNQTHKIEIKNSTEGLRRSAPLSSNFRPVLPELHPLAALAAQLHTQASSCIQDPDIAP